jgi:hypothetical protein
LAPHAPHNIIIEVRKPDNAGNQKKEKCDLGLHRAVLFSASQRVARHHGAKSIPKLKNRQRTGVSMKIAGI